MEHLVLVKASVHHFLQWWNSNNLLQGRPFKDPIPQVTISMDASEVGWGAHLNCMTVQALWTPQQQRHHINRKQQLHRGHYHA